MASALEVMRSDDQIAELVWAFEDCTLPRPAWTHGAHLTVALCYLRRWPRALATERLRQCIQRYNAAVGSGTGYHETITLAWVAVVAQYLAEHDFGQALSSLAAGLLERCGDKHYLQRFYTPAVLLSETARRTWTPPDLAPIEPVDLT